MQIIPETLPVHNISEVIYDDTLVGLEFDIDETDRQQIDIFWNRIYFALLDQQQRTKLAADSVRIADYRLTPSNYDSKARMLGIVLQAFLRVDDDEEIMRGPAVWCAVDIEGNLQKEDGTSVPYPKSMMNHIDALLVEVTQTHQPLETEYL
jgi:hypothetical protein